MISGRMLHVSSGLQELPQCRKQIGGCHSEVVLWSNQAVSLQPHCHSSGRQARASQVVSQPTERIRPRGKK